MPSGWTNTTLGEAARIVAGFAFKSKDFGDQGTPVVKITEIRPPYVQLTNAVKVDTGPYDTKRLERYRLRKGDFLVAMTGATIGKVGRINQETNAYVNQRVAKFEAIPGISDRNFIYYVVSSNGFTQFIDRTSTGSSVQQNISATDIGQLEILLPPLPEQKAIAAVLSSLDDKIELLRRQNETLEKIAQSIFKEWFVEFNFPDKNGKPYKASGGKMVDSELGPIPEGWRVGILEDEFEIIMGQSPPGSSYNEGGDGMVFFQGVAEFGDRFPTTRLYTTDPKKIAEQHDVLLSVRAPVGRLNVAPNRLCIGRGLSAIRSGSRSYALYKMVALQERIARFESEGSVFGAVTKDGLTNLKVIIPSNEIVQQTESILAPIDAKIFYNYKQTVTLAELRDALLPKLMSGELRVGGT